MGKEQQQRKNTEEQSQNQEEKSNDGADNASKTKSNKQISNVVIVLGVYLHCQGCVETVVKSLKGFDGVEEIETNTKDHRVTLKGKIADPSKVAERLRHKSGKHVDLISPVPKKQPDKKAEKKPEAPKVTESVFKVNLHCDGCAKDVKHCLLKMQGVQTVNVDMKESRVIVNSSIDPKKLVAYISKKMGKHAEMVNVKNKKGKNDGEQKEDQHQHQHQQQEKKEKGKDGKNTGFAYPTVPPGLVYAPQLFSDENPNACSIM